MNAVALILCTMVAGADARETIPTSQKLFEVIDNTYAISKRPLEISEDGIILQPVVNKVSHNADGADRPPYLLHYQQNASNYVAGKYELKVIACPGAPNFLLAGYVIQNDHILIGRQPDQPTPRLLHQCFSVLLDTDRNIVVPLDDPKLRLILQGEQIKSVQANCKQIWRDYLSAIDKQESGAPFYEEFRDLRRQFITLPPLESDVSVSFLAEAAESPRAYPNLHDQNRRLVAGMSVRMAIAADQRMNGFDGQIEMQRLLSTTIAQSASAYFDHPPATETTQPTSISE
ncbi:hypothetical protein [Blastopirellula marina]|uniref:Uncharacterized protein n=1 Tax=Blastopirellula marina TaxID=124 RepID=A0A2S8G692_9BACT|nr:hypothetical protein [Blastopirellula marina]PQO39959.1 hypothetical protein C5Y98_06475 [Blastopirellula marina]PTL45334.1 hypothetical protein C5Y97_06475 [Blastopirellula marina]